MSYKENTARVENEPRFCNELSDGREVLIGGVTYKLPAAVHESGLIARVGLGTREKRSVFSMDHTPNYHTPELAVFDVSLLPRDGYGRAVFGGEPISEDIRYMVIDPDTFSWDGDKGYKGIRSGERAVFGRNTTSALRRRFSSMPDTVSRRHVSFEADESGLFVRDLFSRNGTVVSVGYDALLSTAEATEPTSYVHNTREYTRKP